MVTARVAGEPDARWDLLWLAAAIMLSVVPHLTQLGFYSDDWDFLARFSFTDGSLGALFRALQTETRRRPGETLYDATLY